MKDVVARAITEALQSALRESGFMTVAEIYEAAKSRGHSVSPSAVAARLYECTRNNNPIEGVYAGKNQEEGWDAPRFGAWGRPRKEDVRQYGVGWIIKVGDEVVDEGQTSVGGDEDYALQELVAQVINYISQALSDGEIHHDNFFAHVDSLRRIDVAKLHSMKAGDKSRYRVADAEFWIECIDA